MLGILRNKEAKNKVASTNGEFTKEGVKKAKIISLLNQKGGVGKTSMAFNVAHALCSEGNKVLCLDMDPQGNFSSLFMEADSDEVSMQAENSTGIYQLLVNSVKELRSLHSSAFLSDAISSYRPKLNKVQASDKKEGSIDIIPAGQDLSGLDLTLSRMNGPRQLVLKKFIEKNHLHESYDHIIIDGPPTLGLIVVNILCASHGVLFPFIPDSFGEQGLNGILNVLEDIEDMEIVSIPQVIGLIPNLYENRRKQSVEYIENIKNQFSNYHFFRPILNRAGFSKSMALKKSVFHYEAKEYKELQEQFLAIAKRIDTDLNV